MTRLLLTIGAIGVIALNSLPTPASAETNASFRVAAARLRRATLDVINDVGQQKISVMPGDPRVFEPSEKQVEKDSSLWVKEFNFLGPLEPPKKSWLDADVADVQRWAQVLKDDVAAMGADQPADLQATMTDIDAQLAQLQTLTAGPTYENLKIAQTALAIRDDAKKLLSLPVSSSSKKSKRK